LAITYDSAVEVSSWTTQFWRIPLFRFFMPALASLPEFDLAPPPVPTCLVEPLPEIGDSQALEFELGGGLVDLDGLTPTTARALTRFQRIVRSAGGSMLITSAFRPSAYQDHLQAVWDKWMVELRRNREEGCRGLKAEVEAEFTRHMLLESQRPASFSDHTRGISFDASVQLPRRRRRALRLDSLARRAGVLRPARASDPVHFRLIGGDRI
jgi:hypothetical protein